MEMYVTILTDALLMTVQLAQVKTQCSYDKALSLCLPMASGEGVFWLHFVHVKILSSLITFTARMCSHFWTLQAAPVLQKDKQPLSVAEEKCKQKYVVDKS